jgi:exopolysaccharide biosynthesis polyprenyl glycosylphosphotransferase
MTTIEVPKPLGATLTVPTSVGIRRPWETDYLHRLVAVDLLAGTVAGAAGYLLRFGPVNARYTTMPLIVSLLLPFVWVAVLAMFNAYETRMLFVGMEEFHGTLRAGLRLTAGTVLVSYALHSPISRAFLLVIGVSVTALSMAGRFALRRRLHSERQRGGAMRRVLAVGHAGAVAELVHQLGRRRHHGMQIVAACVPEGEHVADVPVVGAPDSAAAAAVAVDADTVVVLPTPGLYGPALRRLAWNLEGGDIDLMTASSLLDVAAGRMSVRPVDGMALTHIEHATLAGPRRAIKTAIETVAAALLLIVAAPAMLLVGALIKLDSTGPAFYRQARVGRNGREFTMIKFRSMSVGADQRAMHRSQGAGVLFKLHDDPRVTRVGRYLRKFSVDELPQLFNVLKGQMSLVGPRPPLAKEVAEYADDVRRRLVVKPGMTGLWQVSGRSDLPWDEAVRLDLHYVENWSLSFDAIILLRTVVAVLRGSGAY